MKQYRQSKKLELYLYRKSNAENLKNRLLFNYFAHWSNKVSVISSSYMHNSLEISHALTTSRTPRIYCLRLWARTISRRSPKILHIPSLQDLSSFYYTVSAIKNFEATKTSTSFQVSHAEPRIKTLLTQMLRIFGVRISVQGF